MDITNDGLVAGKNPFAKSVKFWNGFYRKYAKVFENAAANVMRKDEL